MIVCVAPTRVHFDDAHNTLIYAVPSIVDGATCAGKLVVAEAKLSVNRSRLAQLHEQSLDPSDPLLSDFETERVLLQALAGLQGQALKPESVASNSSGR